MKRIPIAAALLVVLFAGSNLFGQTVNSQVGGVVQDPSNALIPGVTITLTNSATSVASTQISNESGAYSFPSVPPGTYRMTATLPDIQAEAGDVFASSAIFSSRPSWAHRFCASQQQRRATRSARLRTLPRSPMARSC